LSDLPIAPNMARGLRNGRRFGQFNPVGEPAAALGPVTRDYVGVLRGAKLTALEPLTGKPMWIREGIREGSGLFGDDDFLMVTAPESNDVSVYRALDGEFVKSQGLPPAAVRLDTIGRNLIAWQSRNGREELSSHDPVGAADKPNWMRRFDAEALVTAVDGGEAAVLEPGGRLTVVSLVDGHDRWTATIPPPSPLTDHLLAFRSREQYLVLCNEPQAAGNMQWSTPPLSVPINGDVHAFDGATGKWQWTRRIERQALDLNQPAELPVLIFGCPTYERFRNGAGRFDLLCLDRRSGRIAYKDRLDEPLYYLDCRADPEQTVFRLQKHFDSGLDVVGHQSRHSDTEVDRVAVLQLASNASRDDLAFR
jgi:hypothetical protein